MRRQTFDTIRTLVRERAAIVLEEGKEYLVESRLAPLARKRGLANVDALCVEMLEGRSSMELRELVVDAMTTNETSFFRDHTPYEVLKATVLPQVMADNASTRTMDIWSAACSTGQEPYSVAMVIADHFPELAEWTIRIHATDLSRTVLERAERAEYRQVEVNRGLTGAQLVRHFSRDGMVWRLNERVRNRVTFDQVNLMDQWPEMPPFDIVLLRNVLIYFDVEDKEQVLRRVARQLRPGGFLFLGGSESPPPRSQGWRRIEVPRSGCYHRTLES